MQGMILAVGEATIPHDADAYLRPIYGDYMKLPAVESRHPTHSYSDHCPWWRGFGHRNYI